MKKSLIIVLVLLLNVEGCGSLPDAKKSKPVPPGKGTVGIDENTNIHYTGMYCTACHEDTPVKGGNTYLKYNGDYKLLCRCHHGMSPGYCHPLEMKPVADGKMKIPDDFKLTEGEFTCNTCHDVYRQCRKRTFDKKSLRGRPYAKKSDFCFRCHPKDRYQKLNAHNEIDPTGEFIVKMCLYCHERKPDEQAETYNDVTFIGDIKALCRRCHQVRGNHAGNFDHMEKEPSAKGLERLEVMKKKFNIILPLANDGKMTCITCHNPHEKGVIPSDKPSARGADSKYRHRLPGIMCKECHQM